MKTQKTINLGDICESLEEGSNNGDNRPATADDLINDNTKKGNLDKLYKMTLDKKWISQFEKHSSVDNDKSDKDRPQNVYQDTFIEIDADKSESKNNEKFEWYDKIIKQRTNGKRQGSLASSQARSFSPVKGTDTKGHMLSLNLPLVRPKDVAANYDHELL